MQREAISGSAALKADAFPLSYRHGEILKEDLKCMRVKQTKYNFARLDARAYVSSLDNTVEMAALLSTFRF